MEITLLAFRQPYNTQTSAWCITPCPLITAGRWKNEQDVLSLLKSTYTVNLENFARILCSRIALKGLFATIKIRD